MATVLRGLLGLMIAAGLGCASSDSGGMDTGAHVLPPPAATAAGGGCQQAGGAPMACTCVDGRAGVSSCQLDGTYSACNCNGTVPGATPTAGSSATPGGGSGAPPVATAGTSAQPTAGSAAPAVPEPVIVDPADVASCDVAAGPPTENVEVLEIRTSDAVPGGFVTQAGTTYACFWVEIPMPEKRHIVGWEGAINDRAVHHQQVSIGKMPFVIGGMQGGLCALPSVEYTWTGAGGPEWTPSLVGFPIGGPENGGKATFVWQTHFEGATTYTGGFNAYTTSELRKYDAGNFEQGDVRGISIPAMSTATHISTCTPEMTQMKLTHPIYVYAAMEHAHLTIQHIVGELFRDGQLIHTFGDEMSLGFGFFDQRFKPQSPCVQILPGDQIVTTCDYNNTFPFEVMGGEATNQEMCTTFMQYFPRLPVSENNFCGTISGGLGP